MSVPAAARLHNAPPSRLRAGDFVLPDVLQPGLRLVFCGTAAGHASAAAGAYYAHPGNRFWQALHETGLTPRRFAPAEFAQLPRFGIGLTDLAKRHVGNDHELPREAFDAAALRRKLVRFAPRLVAFTSKNAAALALGRPCEYGLLADASFGTTRAFVLPSPSGQARRFWSLEPWQALAAAFAGLR